MTGLACLVCAPNVQIRNGAPPDQTEAPGRPERVRQDGIPQDVDAGAFRPYDLQPDSVTDRHPVPIPRRAPPLLSGRSHRGVQAVVAGLP